MPVRIRLARQGRKGYPYYHIIAADSRAPRDGKFIERLGAYNPNTNPATIELNFDRALQWLQDGAQPSDTAKAILSYEGVLMKKHLLDGVKKGAFDEAAAEEKFNSWMADKKSKIQAKMDKLSADAQSKEKVRLDAERKVNEERAQSIAERNAELAKEAEAEAKAESEEATAEEPQAEEAKAEEPKTEEATAEEPKAPEAKAEGTENAEGEAPAEEKKEE